MKGNGMCLHSSKAAARIWIFCAVRALQVTLLDWRCQLCTQWDMNCCPVNQLNRSALYLLAGLLSAVQKCLCVTSGKLHIFGSNRQYKHNLNKDVPVLGLLMFCNENSTTEDILYPWETKTVGGRQMKREQMSGSSTHSGKQLFSYVNDKSRHRHPFYQVVII